MRTSRKLSDAARSAAGRASATAAPATRTRGHAVTSQVERLGGAAAASGGAGSRGTAAPTASAPAELVVRPAHPGDLAPLSFFFDTALRKDYFVRRGQLQEILSGPHHSVYVAEIDAVLVGVAITTAGTRLINALVHPAYRGLGIGRALVEGSGAKQVRAKIDMSTGDPRGFYAELGFRETGERNEKGNIELMVRDDGVTEARAPGGRRGARASTKRGNHS